MTPIPMKLKTAAVAAVAVPAVILSAAVAHADPVGSFYQWNMAQKAAGLDYFTTAGLYDPATGATTPVSALEQTTAPVASPGSSTEQCIIQHESNGESQVMNSSGHYGLYQFSESTWQASGGNPADFGHASFAEQQQVFNQAVARYGYQPWAGDPCIG